MRVMCMCEANNQCKVTIYKTSHRIFYLYILILYIYMYILCAWYNSPTCNTRQNNVCCVIKHIPRYYMCNNLLQCAYSDKKGSTLNTYLCMYPNNCDPQNIYIWVKVHYMKLFAPLRICLVITRKQIVCLYIYRITIYRTLKCLNKIT